MKKVICLMMCMMMVSPVFAVYVEGIGEMHCMEANCPICGLQIYADACTKMMKPFYEEAKLAAAKTDAELAPEIDELKSMTNAYKGCVRKSSELMEQQSILRGQVDSRELKILALQGEIEQLKASNEISRPARYVALGLGVWGIATFATTGGAYPLLTGCLFLMGAMK